MQLITSLLILLTCSRLLGRFFQIIGLSSIIGEVLAGLLLGSTLLNVITPTQELYGIIELGIFLMIFAAGLEMDLQDVFGAIRKKSIVCSIVGLVFCFISGYGIGFLWGLDLFTSSILSLCFSITALPVVIRFMATFGITETKQGHTIMGGAIILDVVALLFLGVILNIESIHSYFEFFKIVGLKALGMTSFFIVVMVVNKFLRSELLRVSKTKNVIQQLLSQLGDEAIFGSGVLFVLIFSTTTEALGFHFIIGAFFGGLLLNKDIIGVSSFNSMSKTLNAITHQFLTPIFFASIGLYFSIDAFEQPFLLISIVLVGYSAKIIGSGLGAYWVGFNKKEASQIGMALNCKGILDLVVAEIAYSKGYIDVQIFSMLIFSGLASLIITPMLYRHTVHVPQNS